MFFGDEDSVDQIGILLSDVQQFVAKYINTGNRLILLMEAE